MNDDTNKPLEEENNVTETTVDQATEGTEASVVMADETMDADEQTQHDATNQPDTSEESEEEIVPEADSSHEEEAESTETPEEKAASDESEDQDEAVKSESDEDPKPTEDTPTEPAADNRGRWYVVHTFAGHENRVATTLRQRIEAEHLENQIFDILVPTQDKIEIRGGKKETVKEKIFPGYILVKMDLGDTSWLAVRTTQGVTSFVGANNKPTPISDREVQTIVKFTSQGAAPTFKDVFMVDDTVKITDGPFAEFIGKVDSVDKEKGRVRVLVSIFGRETPVELDFLQVQKL